MADLLSDGNSSWLGGMDTSRPPQELSDGYYSKAANLMIGSGLSGLEVRRGFLCCRLVFNTKEEELAYSYGAVQDASYFVSRGQYYLSCVVNGVVFRFVQGGLGKFYCEGININSRNVVTGQTWITKIPNGNIIQNGFNSPLFLTAGSLTRSDPENGGIGIGQAGVYCQHRYFYIDQSGKRIIPSDFNQPLKETEAPIFGNNGFAAPDSDEEIFAIARQKTLLNYIEGGNLIFSTNSDIYSVDVRGARSTWNDLGVPLGKVSETIPGFSAASSYSFEPFNSNIYFRSAQYGMSDLRQSEYQFSNLDSLENQALEANYYFSNDTPWMLYQCRTRSYNKRLLTTVGPEQTQDGDIYWNGIISYCPASMAQEQKRAPQRYESVWTGVRPWCMTVVKRNSASDILFVHSYDNDGKNRLYMMDGSIDYDINTYGERKEIESFIETRGYHFGNQLALKTNQGRFLKTQPCERTISFQAFVRPEVSGTWNQFYEVTHNICRSSPEKPFNPLSTQPIGKTFNMSAEKFASCYSGPSFQYIQYRFEFKGPIKIDWFALASAISNPNQDVTKTNEECEILIYTYRPDYNYLISKPNASSTNTSASSSN